MPHLCGVCVCVCVCADQCHWPVRLHRRDSVSVPVEPEEMCSSAEPPPMQSAQSEAPHLHTHTRRHLTTRLPPCHGISLSAHTLNTRTPHTCTHIAHAHHTHHTHAHHTHTTHR